MRTEVFQKLYARLTRARGVHDAKDSLVFSVIIISALIVIGARTLAPFEVGKDQATQLEAAQRLVAGFGLTTTNDVVPRESFDITVAPPSKYLTWWPPGFSLLVAALLYIGLPLLAALKIIYATLTLLGWIGWAIIASHFIARPSDYGATSSRIHLIIAALLPVFFTPWWGGTDVFLWAGIPFVFLWLFRAESNQPSFLLAALAGLLFGSLYAIRYASLFIGLAAALILFQVTYPDIKSFLKRMTVFFVSSLFIIVPVAIYIHLHSQSAPSMAEDASLIHEPHSLLNTVDAIINCLPVASNLILSYPLFEQVVYRLNSSWLIYAAGIMSLLSIVSLPVILWRSAAPNARKAREDMALGFSFLPFALLVFLVTIMFMNYGDLLKVRRYYEPLALGGVFICYEIAIRRATYRAVKKASKAIVLMFALYVCVYLPALAFIPDRKDYVVSSVLSFTPSGNPKYQSTSQKIGYPSLRLYSRKESTRTKLKQLYKENPQALFYVEEYGYFIYDEFRGGPAPGSSLRVFPKIDFWRQAYTSKPVKIFWVLDRDTELDFVSDSNQKLVFSDPYERTKILVSNFPVGHFPPNEQIAGSPLKR